jgi:fused signal recognition particle receptor
MTTIQLVLLICIIAVIVAAAVVFAVVHNRKNSSSDSDSATTVPAATTASGEGDRSGEEMAAQASGDRDADTRSAEGAAPATTATSPAAGAASPSAETPESSASRLVRLRSRLAGSGNPFGKALFSILSRDNLSEADWEDVEDTLLLADVGAEASEQIVDSLRSDARVTGEKSPEAVHELLRERLLDAVGADTDRSLAFEHADGFVVPATSHDSAGAPGAVPSATPAPASSASEHNPSVIIMVGVNGTGKTTTAGKLGRLLVSEGKKVILGAADTFRAAAADQLETWGKRVGIEVVRAPGDGADPASVAFDAANEAKKQNADVLIVDTAGRLQNKANLMDELGKIRRVVEKTMPVEEVLLVLDATTGQNGMSQARVFAQAIGITGVVLTKLDGSAKGGIVISVQRELGVPVKLVGLGEGPDDLAPFDPASFVDGILG